MAIIYFSPNLRIDFQVALVVKNPSANAGRRKRCRFDPWVEKTPWKGAWQPTPVFLPGESHGQRSLAVHRVAQSQTQLKQLSKAHPGESFY